MFFFCAQIKSEKYELTAIEAAALKSCERQGETRGLMASAAVAFVGGYFGRRPAWAHPAVRLSFWVGSSLVAGTLAEATVASSCLTQLTSLDDCVLGLWARQLVSEVDPKRRDRRVSCGNGPGAAALQHQLG